MAFSIRTTILIQIITLISAILVALVVKPFLSTEHHVLWAVIAGRTFLIFLSWIMIPVIIMNVLTAIVDPPSGASTIIVLRMVGCFIVTSLLCVTIGILCSLAIPSDGSVTDILYHPIDAFYTFVMNMCPRRLVGPFIEMAKFDVIFEEKETVIDGILTTVTHSELKVTTINAFNYLGIITLSFVFALVLRRDDPPRVFLNNFTRITEQAITCAHYLLPFGFVGLSVQMMAHSQNWSSLINMGMFIGVVICGLVAYAVVLLPLLFVLLVRRNPIPLMKDFYKDVLFSTLVCTPRASVLEMCQRKCEEAGVAEQIWRLVLPVGFKLNLNATVLYEVAVVVFITRIQNISLDIGQMVVLGVTVAVVVIGTGGIRCRGAVVSVFVLNCMGIESYYYTGLLGVCEILLYPLCNAVDILNNCLAAVIIHHTTGSSLYTPDGNTGEQVLPNDPQETLDSSV